jgi:nitric oxide reductase NorQ protein
LAAAECAAASFPPIRFLPILWSNDMKPALHAVAAPMPDLPAYIPSGRECALFEHAWRHRLPVLLKGPTGCGKTRFVAHMAARLGLPLHTVACHDDLTAADLTGRYLLKGGDTVWTDGPLTRAVREGGICYLDEVVEARKDVTVVLHPLTDNRRILPLERTGEELAAPASFMLVVSYNPGYQTLLKALKPSTRQRFVAIEFGFLPPEQEIAVVAAESGLVSDRVQPLVALAGRLRALKGHDLEEGVSTRLVVYCATLVAAGASVADAVLAGMIEPLTDDADVKAALLEVARAVIG